jgi:hypothetical protein
MSVFDAENIPPSGRMGVEPLKVGVLSKAAVKQQAVHKQQRCGAPTDRARPVSRCQRPRALTCRKYEELIAQSKGADALNVWIECVLHSDARGGARASGDAFRWGLCVCARRYFSWMQQSLPESERNALLLPALKQCIRQFEGDVAFHNHDKYLKVWINYVRVVAAACWTVG